MKQRSSTGSKLPVVDSGDSPREQSDRPGSESALIEAGELFRNLVENASDLIWEVDESFRFVYLNPRVKQLLGYKPEEIVGKTPFDLMDENEAEEIRDLFGDIIVRQDPFTLRQSVLLHKTGRKTVFETSGMPVFDAAGELTGYRGISRDVTDRQQDEDERKKLEAQVLKTQKLESLGVLAGGIAHDFNNLLTSILSNAELALAELPPLSQLRDPIEEIEAAAKRAAELSSKMLAYSGKGRFIVKELNVSELVGDLRGIFESSVASRIAIRCSFAENLPAVSADADELRQVVTNLITNAAEAIGDAVGTITIRTGAMHCDEPYLRDTWLNEELEGGRYVFLEVSDTGPGMDEETRQKIFDPFFTTKFTGRGLGLAAVLGIVRGHKGTIKLSTEPGCGTSFTVLLPSKHRASDSSPAAHDSTGLPRNGTILLVDDEPLIIRAGGSMLRRIGFSVLTAVNGEEAVSVFRERAAEIDCVIMDLSMPVMDGVEALGELQKIRSDACVVLASGYSEHEIEEQYFGEGFSGFLQKPYQSESLLDALDTAYNKRND